MINFAKALAERIFKSTTDSADSAPLSHKERYQLEIPSVLRELRRRGVIFEVMEGPGHLLYFGSSWNRVGKLSE